MHNSQRDHLLRQARDRYIGEADYLTAEALQWAAKRAEDADSKLGMHRETLVEVATHVFDAIGCIDVLEIAAAQNACTYLDAAMRKLESIGVPVPKEPTDA